MQKLLTKERQQNRQQSIYQPNKDKIKKPNDLMIKM